MGDTPWLSIIGLGEDGPEGLPIASRSALWQAEVIMGPPRHLRLLGEVTTETVEWPVPFSDGIDVLMAMKGRKVAVLASGDPFWFGAGTALTRLLEPGEWRAFPGPSCFGLTAARLGWPMEQVDCLGLHAKPLSRLRPALARGARLIVTLRDGAAVTALGRYLTEVGFGSSTVWVLEALGGPRERVTSARADALDGAFGHPVVAAIEVGDGPALPCVPGLPDDRFDHDGQITKRPVRALTLSALAPRPGEMLWDIGGGSGSVAIEWLLAHPANRAISIEADATRADRLVANAAALGVDRLACVTGRAPDALDGLDVPDAVFVGGGLSAALLERLMLLAPGTRIVANAVTLESEAMLVAARAAHGGDLMRIDLAQAKPLGTRTGWAASYPIVQWAVVL
ncbi:Precorrin-6Y C(5,15)-methyltransferase [decarboxylating] [Marinibacterium anthonyi]|nr:Precorrin-6Y C(5,15)-methyltransferase [decarboxylating] [Marinibacterium anthonyi]